MSQPELDVLTRNIGDEHLNELMFNGYHQAFAERDGKLGPIPSPFKSEQEFDSVVSVITSFRNTVIIDGAV